MATFFARARILAVILIVLGSGCSRKDPPPFVSIVPKELPAMSVTLERLKLDGSAWRANEEIASSTATESSVSSSVEAGTTNCPEIVVGDLNSTVIGEAKFPESCTPRVKLRFIRHPVALTASIFRGDSLLDWFQKNPDAQRLFSSEFGSGILAEPEKLLSLRAEDWKFEGLRGAVFRQLFADALHAEAQVHYDITHGDQGLVFSYVRTRAPLTETLLPHILRHLGKAVYTSTELPNSIVEVRPSTYRLFITEKDGRLYFSNGLEALANVLDQDSTILAAQDETVILSVRSEAFFNRLLRSMVGNDKFRVDLALKLDASVTQPVSLTVAGAQMFNHLRPKLFEGTVAAIPHDVFSGIVTSFYLSPDMQPDDWARLGKDGASEAMTSGPSEGGIALLWELQNRERSSGEEQLFSDVGIVVANIGSAHPVDTFRKYFRESAFVDSCAGGMVLIAASAEPLMMRMREACESRSASARDWARSTTWKPSENQLSVFLNPGVGVSEILRGGGLKADSTPASENTPEWKKSYAEAVQRIQRSGEAFFQDLPIVLFSGRATTSGGVLPAYLVKQERGAQS